jgi:DNA-binding XRE family transcriptional regulator
MRTRIKDLRLEKKLSQQALAKNLSLNQSTLSKIECEIAVPDALLVSDSFMSLQTMYCISPKSVLMQIYYWLTTCFI